jgi:hypothetical protein
MNASTEADEVARKNLLAAKKAEEQRQAAAAYDVAQHAVADFKHEFWDLPRLLTVAGAGACREPHSHATHHQRAHREMCHEITAAVATLKRWHKHLAEEIEPLKWHLPR